MIIEYHEDGMITVTPETQSELLTFEESVCYFKAQHTVREIREVYPNGQHHLEFGFESTGQTSEDSTLYKAGIMDDVKRNSSGLPE